MTKTPPTQFEQTHISIVVDMSGSMVGCRQSTIASLNKYLAELRSDDATKEADCELSVFNTAQLNVIRKEPPCRAKDLSLDDYVPYGGTPLYDAIGRGIGSLDARLAKAKTKKAILVMATDGEENSSRKYPRTPEGFAAISGLIKARQEAGWLVVFLGAGLDSARQGAALGIRADTVANIGLDHVSMNNMAVETSGMMRGYAATQDAESARLFAASASYSPSARASMGDATGGAGLKKPFANPPGTPGQLPSKHGNLGYPVAGTAPPSTLVVPQADAWEKDKKADAWGDKA